MTQQMDSEPAHALSESIPHTWVSVEFYGSLDQKKTFVFLVIQSNLEQFRAIQSNLEVEFS